MYFQRDVSAFKFNASNFSHRSNELGFADCNFQPAMGTEPPGTGMLAHPIGLGGKPFPKKIRPLGKNGMAGGFFRSARPKASQTALAPSRLSAPQRSYMGFVRSGPGEKGKPSQANWGET